MNFSDYRKKQMKDPEVRKEYLKITLCLSHQVSKMILDLRLRVGLTQGELAKRIGTKQPAVARLENESYYPSFRTIQKILDSTGYGIEIKLKKLNK